MDRTDEDARQLMEKAQRRASGGLSVGGRLMSWLSGNSGPSSSSEKLEDAAELYTQAANKFKMNKEYLEAGMAFLKASEMHQQLGEDLDRLSKLVSAASCLKKVDPEKAIEPYKKALEEYAKRGRLHNAAKYAKELAEIYENDMKEFQEAVYYYQKSADWYQAEDANATANQSLTKAALLYGLMEQYDTAIEKFEEIARSALASQLTRYSVKDHLFKALLCSLCQASPSDTSLLLDKYKGLDSTFGGTRECQLIEQLLNAWDQDSVKDFEEHLSQFDRLLPLDDWKTSLLLRVKKYFEEDPGVEL